MSNNLNIVQMTTSQAQKETTHNDANAQLDAAITETYDADVSAGNVTLSSAQFRGAVRFLVEGAATSGRELILPAVKHMFLVTADVGNTDPITVVKGTTTFDLDPDDTAIFYTDGTADGLVQVAGGGGGGFNVATTFIGQPGPADTLCLYVFTESVEFPAGLTDSQAVCVVDPAGAVTLAIKKNGAGVGTVNFAMGATTATFTMASDQTFAPGDIMIIEAPNPADADFEDVAITLIGSR